MSMSLDVSQYHGSMVWMMSASMHHAPRQSCMTWSRVMMSVHMPMLQPEPAILRNDWSDGLLDGSMATPRLDESPSPPTRPTHRPSLVTGFGAGNSTSC